MPRMIPILLWVWVVGAFAVYLLQFRPIVGPMGKALGLW